jgi:hypothetical protein
MAERPTVPSAPGDLRSRATVEILRELGYAVAWSEDGGSCTVRGEDERFDGSGSDGPSALRDALRVMLPTRVARAAFDAQVDRRAAALSVDTVPQRLAPPVMRDRPRPQVVTVSESRGLGPRSPSRMVVTTVGSGAAPILRPAPPPQTAGYDGDVSRVSISVDEALSELSAVRARVEDAVAEVSLMAPSLQRAHVLAWITRARSIEEQFPTDRQVQHTTQTIARRLTHLCKIWWPGTVRALQLHTTVEQAARNVEPAPRPIPRRWGELAELLESRLEAIVGQPGFDDGWLDGAAQFPAPAERVQFFARLRAAVERVGGALGQPPVDRADSVRVSDGDVQEFVDVAQRLRWLRSSAPDPEHWGAAIGRIRFLITGLGDRGLALKSVLDPAYRPRGTWHETLARGPGEEAAPVPTVGSESEVVAELFALERARVSGQRVLLVAHREDDELRERLRESLGVELTWCVSGARNVDDAAKSIARGAYDVVLGATAFQEHGVDTVLSRACALAVPKVRYVRVNRPRLAACARALAREFGIPST